MTQKLFTEIANPSNLVTQYAHLSALDGFRACLALWVYLGHLAAAAGFENRLLSAHPLAVDLFMVLSGFLMVHTWKSSADQKLFSKNTLSFYCIRFFRIAPLYYFLLLVCYIWTPVFDQMHDFSLKAIPPIWAQGIAGFDPQSIRGFDSIQWVVMHLSFLFGMVPGMENNSPLPDWSLSLEMQFYLILPVLLIWIRKTPLLLTAIFAAILAALSPRLFGNYLDSGILTHFGQPSFLPYRLNAFLAGMILAIWLRNEALNKNSRSSKIYTVTAALICVLPLSKLVILAYIIFVFLVTNQSPRLSKLLSLKPLRFLGDISYSIYLSHILVVTPIIYWLIKDTRFLTIAPSIRFLWGLGLTAPLVVTLSYLLYRFIEQPSIAKGKWLSRRILKKS